MRIHFEDDLETTHLGKALREKRGLRSLREVAHEARLTVATLSRMENGGRPDLDSFAAAMRWLQIPPKEWLHYMQMERE